MLLYSQRISFDEKCGITSESNLIKNPCKEKGFGVAELI